MEEKVRIQDDLYEAVNGDWIKNAVIPDDRPYTGGFADLDEQVEKILLADFASFASGAKNSDILGMPDAIRFYKIVNNEAKRNEDGIKPILATLERIRNLKTVADLNKEAPAFFMDNLPLPFQCGVEPDMEDATKHSFVMLGPSIILPDTTYYAPDNQAGKALLGVYANMAKALLAKTPLKEEEIETFVSDALEFDALVATKVKSQVEWADYVSNHNPIKTSELAESMKPFDLNGFLKALFGKNIPETIIAYDPKALKEFNGYFSSKTFIKYVHWCYVRTLVKASSYLSTELVELGSLYRRTLTGVQKSPSIEKQAYRAASSAFSEPIGVYYGRTYFGEEAKKDVEAMVHKIIETYEDRIKHNAFLKDQTKEKAILKLSTMEIKMGYPDEVRPYFGKLHVDENDTYYEAARKIGAVETQENLDKLYKKVDRTEWVMPGHMVNACYNPNSNDITFPAAILQKPFYSIHQKPEENLGGIGAVIGHEISHAFDNNGAHFDENGNLADWWLKEDYEAFQKLTQEMIEQFDGLEYHGGHVNGELVVSENIADNGGMAVTLAIMKTIKDADYQAYFKNWARVWCQKAKEEFIQLLLASDVHSPVGLRANIQPRNFPEWYEAFDVKPSDKMYIEEGKRIIIW